VRSFAIVTPANSCLPNCTTACRSFSPGTLAEWLGEKAASRRVKSLLVPYPVEDLVICQSTAVGNVKNKDPSLMSRYGTGGSARTTVFANSHVSEDCLGHLAHSSEGRWRRTLDTHGHRGMPGSDEGAVAAHLVADEHRLVKTCVDRTVAHRPRRAASPDCSGEIHLGEQPSAEDVAFGLAWPASDDAHERQGRRNCEASLPWPPFHCESRGASIGDVTKFPGTVAGGQ